jgi:hypothetical protein
MQTYKVTIKFQTDRALTQEELETLEGLLSIQVEEPTNWNSEYMDWSGQNITIETSSNF